MGDDVYFEAVTYKFRGHAYPLAILDCNLNFTFANSRYCRLMSLNFDPEIKQGFKDLNQCFSDLCSIYDKQTRNVLLHLKPLSFIDVLAAGGRTFVYHKRMTPLIAPSKAVLGIEVHLISMASIIGSATVLSRASWHDRDDSTVGPVPEQANKADLTEYQEAYLFFVMQGFSNSEISNCLNVSKSTVENMIRIITIKMRKHSASPIVNRSDLKYAAIKLGYAFILPRAILRPHSIPLQHNMDDWIYLDEF